MYLNGIKHTSNVVTKLNPLTLYVGSDRRTDEKTDRRTDEGHFFNPPSTSRREINNLHYNAST